MTKITKAIRQAARTILADSDNYDAATMQISRDGMVSAKRDANKTYAADAARYLIGHIDAMVTADGMIREGW